MRSRGPRYTPFNPFIVLSDATISTLVVVTCLLMIYMARGSKGEAAIQKAAEEKETLANQVVQLQKAVEEKNREIDQLKEGKQERLKSIETRQQALAEAMAGGFKEEVPKNFGVSYAQGDSTFLVRFFDSGMFAGDGGLSPRGVQALQVWARHVGSVLGRQARESGVGSKPGAPIEVQVRGHCSTAKASGDPGWDLSLRRAHEAVRVLEGSLKRVDFPLCLLSITGMADYRPAYKSTKGVLETEMGKDPELKALGPEGALAELKTRAHRKARLADRLDILVLYSGGENQNNYVQAVDPRFGKHFGPVNDTSDPVLGELSDSPSSDESNGASR